MCDAGTTKCLLLCLSCQLPVYFPFDVSSNFDFKSIKGYANFGHLSVLDNR